ncbi:MAG: hypothetical protein RBR67_17905 [Desulfobacterium sp.]|nr:hypothetical protein [Desulfobacterium sp.]
MQDFLKARMGEMPLARLLFLLFIVGSTMYSTYRILKRVEQRGIETLQAVDVCHFISTCKVVETMIKARISTYGE